MYNMAHLKGVIFRVAFVRRVSSISAENICYQVLRVGVALILLINTVNSHLLSSVVEMKKKISIITFTSLFTVRNCSVLSILKALI